MDSIAELDESVIEGTINGKTKFEQLLSEHGMSNRDIQ
jgi:hypothetical protein